MRAADRLLLAALLAYGAVTPAHSLSLEPAGGVFPIVVPRQAVPAERTAARELAAYLGRATGVRFQVVQEGEGPAVASSIHVGPTAAARRAGIRTEDLGPEEWRILSEGERLILAGGRPRGTLYAVYRLLEDHVGVRWWTPFVESVPTLERLVIPELDRRGQPSFGYRDVIGLSGPRQFGARNRMNGHFAFLPREWGGTEAYGPPSMSHDFYLYVPPEEYFESHPEYFSELDGERTGRRAQLCLTNDGLLELATSRLREYIGLARREAAESGELAPRLFAFSQNDWGGACTCEPCRDLARREGSESAALIRFVNGLARGIERDYPDVLIDTLAYHYTFEPPREIEARDNVVIRLAALQRRDFSKPVTHRVHRSFRRAIDGWRAKAGHLRIWGYSVTFGDRANLPLPNLRVLAEDFRYYLNHGIEGVFMQHDDAVLGDMRDLKLWVMLKLAEQPELDVDDLILQFTDGYYGPAAEPIREYLGALERAASDKPSSIGYPARASSFRYLDRKFLRQAQRLFDQASARVANDPELSRRVRHARLSLDRATLMLWHPKLGRSRTGRTPLDPGVIAERYWRSVNERIDRELLDAQRERKREAITGELEGFRDAIRD